MRAIVIGEDRRFVPADFALPEPGTGQVRVDVSYCGICGSELHMRPRPELYPVGAVMGHEFSGRIVALGADAGPWQVGDRVCVLPFDPCRVCEFCRCGDTHLCPTGGANGVGLGRRPGGYAESVLVDAGMLFRLPESVGDREGALVEPVAVAVHAVERARIAAPAPVMVIGAGPIGVLVAIVARAYGHEPVIVLERNPQRLASAAGLGLRAELADGDVAGRVGAPRLVFESAGSPAALESAVELVGRGGQVVLVGMALDEPVRFRARALISKEADVAGAIAYRRRDFDRAIELIADGTIPCERLITTIAPLDEAEAQFAALSDPTTAQIKVLLQP